MVCCVAQFVLLTTWQILESTFQLESLHSFIEEITAQTGIDAQII
jgi:hypothetical protein